ncbi:MAG TPA: DNA polymerase ligase N-terminal domain-containing protein, partial [Longimicrobiales bacterium]|nr:DNA polymerase ligase N-terminal domain-containing protein [Longimicrobiales bacterium]
MPSVKKELTKYRRMRDFSKTREPAGGAVTTSKRGRKSRLRFVIQKHAATQLHYDLRLELDGVMKSWAVPKGPSLDPAVKRLAMEVEDHPVEYNTFEGIIPEGEYGGGTVMIWDQGKYTADQAEAGDDAAAIRAGLNRGDLKFTLQGKRLQGSFVLVRTRRSGERAQWLLIKHRDEHAIRGSDIAAEEITSVVSGRTMEEIARGESRLWHSNRAVRRKTSDIVGAKTLERARRADWAGKPRATEKPARKAIKKKTARALALDVTKAITPMLATLGKDMPADDGWTFEPKYDGIRVLAFVTGTEARLITRNLKDKTRQFPEIIADLKKLPGKTGSALVLDGEIVALAEGEPARFQELQARMHVENEAAIKRRVKDTPVALLVFDQLVDDADILLDQPWSARRARLQKRLARRKLPAVRLGATSADGAGMLLQA